jgi:hypothetical protein
VSFLALVFVFFKYTTIAQGNAQVRRMRTAFDQMMLPYKLGLTIKNTKKLLVIKTLWRYGHGAQKHKKYLPNAFLSNVATDSWYVLIWVEEGIVGLMIHLGILFYVMIKASLIVMFK